MTGARAFVIGSPARRAGLVLLTNSNRGLRLVAALTAAVLPADHPAIRWLADGVGA